MCPRRRQDLGARYNGQIVQEITIIPFPELGAGVDGVVGINYSDAVKINKCNDKVKM